MTTITTRLCHLSLNAILYPQIAARFFNAVKMAIPTHDGATHHRVGSLAAENTGGLSLLVDDSPVEAGR